MPENDNIPEFLDRYLITVSKPARYTGGEFNQIKKSWDESRLHIALAFPDIYEIGLPNLGMAILYDSINNRADALAERVYCPWGDMEALLREHQIPLFSLENKVPLGMFDLVGFTLPYESLYTNLLTMVNLAAIPMRSRDRDESSPLIIAGGHACFNPEPMHAFIDAFVIGEGEEVMHELLDTLKFQKKQNSSREKRLHAIGEIEGVYIPADFRVEYHPNRKIKSVAHITNNEKRSIKKRVVRRLPAPVTRFLVPNLRTVNERAVIEVMRGCSRGCRFCQAGMINRPVRERSREEIIRALKEAISSTGFEEISLLSLSSSDHSQISGMVRDVMLLSEARQISFSLPSLRVESFTPELISSMKGKRKGNFTIAPEAGNERLRKLINKPIPDEDIIDTITQIFQMGWTNLKLYFMVGFPQETIEDINSIVDLCWRIKTIARKILGGKAKIHISVNTLIPKAHTPFQWLAFSQKNETQEKYRLISDGLRKSSIKVDWPHYENALLEAWLSRGDRRLADVIELAWEKGARFDAWQECFQFSAWQAAFEELGVDIEFYTHRERDLEEILPWDHINAGITKSFLLREVQKSQDLTISEDCRGKCHACGIQSNFDLLCDDVRSA